LLHFAGQTDDGEHVLRLTLFFPWRLFLPLAKRENIHWALISWRNQHEAIGCGTSRRWCLACDCGQLIGGDRKGIKHAIAWCCVIVWGSAIQMVYVSREP